VAYKTSGNDIRIEDVRLSSEPKKGRVGEASCASFMTSGVNVLKISKNKLITLHYQF
jgi:hypothetical protein